jgi:uncharacterized repeat protein (TIGR01451 family)
MLVQFPQPGMGLPIPAPVLPGKVLAPKGVRVTAFPGSPLARMFDAPAVFAFRPGYTYRLELSNLPYHPGRTLYPEIEVRGILVPRIGMKYMDYPVPLTFSQADIEKALGGAVVTKYIYLEDPEKAIPTEVLPDSPIEFPNGTEEEAYKSAMANGRLVAVVRLGDRKPLPDWLRATAIDGTILMPGERYLKSPIYPPTIPYYACPMFDPLLGPKGPKGECFDDGGDKGNPLGIGPGGRLGGLDPTDVSAEYTIAGKRRVTTSNIVCICSPRFMIQRAELIPGGFNVPVVVAANVGTMALQKYDDRRAPMAEIGREKPVGMDGKQRPMAYVGKVGIAFFVGTSRPMVHAQIEGVQIAAALVEPEQLTIYPGHPLTVTKMVEPGGPVAVGDIVTITIKYANTGNRAVSDLVVSDSLSGRLEYVVGTAETDRAANFSATPNDVGSVVVRWDLPGVLLPGQSGVVRFKAKIR